MFGALIVFLLIPTVPAPPACTKGYSFSCIHYSAPMKDYFHPDIQSYVVPEGSEFRYVNGTTSDLHEEICQYGYEEVNDGGCAATCGGRSAPCLCLSATEAIDLNEKMYGVLLYVALGILGFGCCCSVGCFWWADGGARVTSIREGKGGLLADDVSDGSSSSSSSSSTSSESGATSSEPVESEMVADEKAKKKRRKAENARKKRAQVSSDDNKLELGEIDNNEYIDPYIAADGNSPAAEEQSTKMDEYGRPIENSDAVESSSSGVSSVERDSEWWRSFWLSTLVFMFFFGVYLICLVGDLTSSWQEFMIMILVFSMFFHYVCGYVYHTVRIFRRTKGWSRITQKFNPFISACACSWVSLMTTTMIIVGLAGCFWALQADTKRFMNCGDYNYI